MKFRTLLRITVGGLFFGHGAHKLFGWWGGRGLDATAQGFESMGMRPGRANAIAAGVSEAGGGAALALGLASPLAESSLIATMLTAIHRVHLKNGIWATSGGYEYNLVLIIALLTLADTGPGPVSLDHALGWERSGLASALAVLAVGGAGAYGAYRIAEAYAPAPEPEATAPPATGGEPADATEPSEATPAA